MISIHFKHPSTSRKYHGDQKLIQFKNLYTNMKLKILVFLLGYVKDMEMMPAIKQIIAKKWRNCVAKSKKSGQDL